MQRSSRWKGFSSTSIQSVSCARRLFFIFFFCLLLIPGVSSQDQNLIYKPRAGGYNEGIKARDISGPYIDLISAIASDIEPASELPANLRIKFYLKEAQNVYITVQEIKKSDAYLLDHVSRPWRSGYWNDFEWPTSLVIKHLTIPRVSNLGVVARLKNEVPSSEEEVAPVIFYDSTAPKKISSYHFIYVPHHAGNFTYDIYGPEKNQKNNPIFHKDIGFVYEGSPVVINWDASKAIEGIYTVVLNWMEHETIHFYHKPTVE